MGKHIVFLITLLQQSEMLGHTTLKVSLKIDKTKYEGDWFHFPMMKESREIIRDLLPPHCKSVGPIIKVETIFESHEVK